MWDISAQGLGILAFILLVLSFQQKEKNRLLEFQMAANFFFVVSYTMLGALTGTVMCAINFARSFVFRNGDKNWGKSRVWFYVFLVAPAIVGAIFWSGISSLFIIAGTILVTVALYVKDHKLMRRLLVLCPPLYFVYNFANNAIGGMSADAFSFISTLIALWRFDLRKKNTP